MILHFYKIYGNISCCLSFCYFILLVHEIQKFSTVQFSYDFRFMQMGSKTFNFIIKNLKVLWMSWKIGEKSNTSRHLSSYEIVIEKFFRLPLAFIYLVMICFIFFMFFQWYLPEIVQSLYFDDIYYYWYYRSGNSNILWTFLTELACYII